MLSFRGQKAFLGCKLKLLSEHPFGDQMGATSIYSDILWAISCTQAQICGSQKGALQACTEELNSRLSPQLSVLTERLEPQGWASQALSQLSRQREASLIL